MSLLATDHGFITYDFPVSGAMAGACYIQDIYISPEQRKQGLASQLTDLVVGQCRERGVTRLYGSAVPSTAGSTGSLIAMLAYGFVVDSAYNDLIILRKDL